MKPPSTSPENVQSRGCPSMQLTYSGVHPFAFNFTPGWSPLVNSAPAEFHEGSLLAGNR